MARASLSSSAFPLPSSRGSSEARSASQRDISAAAWDQGHLPGALHIPGGELSARAASELPDRDADIVVYCWGPGCNGATKAAFTLSGMGYRRVRELIGGFEYWAREGLSVVTAHGRTRRAPDSLTAVAPTDFTARVQA